QGIENPRVGGSIPSSATIFRDLQKCRSFFLRAACHPRMAWIYLALAPSMPSIHAGPPPSG
ncbi:hypothetical protein, partial [Stenotrophomonas maltophilia]|uniref:hypothetical protein n=2 Tax=Stenotrophomonas maltophilia TaxID=40324 RepID=UPI0019553316